MGGVFLIELIIVFALVLGWAVWEYRKTSALHRQTKEQERTKADDTVSPPERE